MKSKKYIMFIFRELSPYKAKIFVLSLLILLSGLGNLIIPLLQQHIIDNGIMANNLNMLIKLVFLVIFIYILISIITYIQNRIQADINCDFNKSLHIQVMNHLLRIKKVCLDREGVIKLSKNADYCIESISQITSNSVLLLVLEFFKLIGIMTALTIINWRLALFMFAFIPIKLCITMITSYYAQRYSFDNLQEHQELHKWEEDMYLTIPEIKLWNLYDIKCKEYNKIVSKIFNVLRKISLLGAKDTQLGEGLAQIIFNLLYLLAGIMIWKNTLTIGGLLVIASYYTFILEPVALFSSLKLLFSNLKPMIDKFEKFMNLPEEDEHLGTKKLDNSNIDKKHLEIIFENIVFSYNNKKILNKINLKFNYGEKIALVGINGAGKTTLIDLLLRFNEPLKGKILLNDIDIKDYQVDSYRELFGVVTQNPNLFNTSIEKNITVFNRYLLNENLLKEPLFRFLNKLPDGVKSEVGSKSVMLSGGEKQKIAFARVLTKKPKIFILDEPTSNYDIESKKIFYDLISKMAYTTIIISHDIEVLKRVSKIVVLEKGNAYVFDSYSRYLSSKYYCRKELETSENNI